VRLCAFVFQSAIFLCSDGWHQNAISLKKVQQLSPFGQLACPVWRKNASSRRTACSNFASNLPGMLWAWNLSYCSRDVVFAIWLCRCRSVPVFPRGHAHLSMMMKESGLTCCFIHFAQHCVMCEWKYETKTIIRRQKQLLLLLLHPFNGLFSRTTWVSWYQKVKTSLD